MFTLMITSTFGYVVGPLLAGLLEVVLTSLHIESSAVNSDSAPGWFMAVVYGALTIKACVLFQNPPPLPAAPALKEEKIPRSNFGKAPILGLVICLWCIIAASVSNSVVEVYLSKIAQQSWGWNVQTTSLYLAFVAGSSMPMCFFVWHLTRIAADRVVLLCVCPLGALFSVIFFDFHLQSVAAQALVLALGLVAVLEACTIVKAFSMSLATKLVPADWKASVSIFSTMLLIGSRGVGLFCGVWMEPISFAATQIVLYVASCMLVLLGWSQLKPFEAAG